ncbi:phage tail tape measure protein [Sphingomonas sp. UMB7805-LC452B]|nr:phage tail tape measure protein [Sphingomonas sp. UMB7805-LC452B]MDK8216391.1 phage tail tape measure protein [Sphingomonas sp. UMB7805-LC452B]
MRNAGLIMTAGLTVPLGLVAKSAKDTAADFQTAMNKVHSAMLDATPEQLDKLRQAALDMGPAFGKSAIEAAGAIENLAKNGMSAAEILNGGLNGALTLAVVGQADLGAAADATTDILQQFHLSASQLPTIVDKVSGALDASKLSFEGYKDAIGQVGGIAGGLGYDFEDMNTALAAVIPLMTGGSDAGTSFKTFLLSLKAQSKDAQKVMDDLGISFFDASHNALNLAQTADVLHRALDPLDQETKRDALTKMFGTDGMRVALALMQAGADGIAKVQEQIDKASANQKIAVLMDGEAQATQRLASAWEKLKIVIGEAGIIQFFTMVKEGMASVINALASGPPWFYKIMVGIAAVTATLGPLLIALTAVAKVGFVVFLARLGPVAAAIAAIINPIGFLTRALASFAIQVGAASAVGRFGAALLSVTGPVGILVTGLSLLVPLFLRKADASDAATEAVKSAEDADRKAAEASIALATATGKVRDALLDKARADRIVARDALLAANANLQAAKASYVRAKADAENPMNFATNVGSPGAVNVATYGRGATVERTRADLEARIKETETRIGALNKINALIASASAPEPGKVHMDFEDGKGGSKGRAAKGRDAAQDEARYLDDLGRSRVDLLRARADMTESARARHTADVAALEEDRAAYGRQVALDEGLTDAKRRALLAKRDEADEIERAVIDQTLFRAETQAAYDIAVAENEAQQDHLRAQLDLVDSVQQRRDIELKLLDLQRQKEEADLELILATKANTSSEWEKARLRKDRLDGVYADRRASVMRQNDSPAEAYGRTVNASASAINERVQEGAINGLRDLNAGLTDAIMGTAKLGDAFENMGKRIIASLIDIAIQQAVIRPMADALFGKADAQGNRSGGSLAGIGSFFARTFGGGRATGGSVSSSGWYVVGEQGPELFAPGVNGTIVPNGGLAAGGGRSPAVVQLLVGEGQMFEPRVQSISGGVSVQTIRSAGRSNAMRARQSLD